MGLRAVDKNLITAQGVVDLTGATAPGTPAAAAVDENGDAVMTGTGSSSSTTAGPPTAAEPPDQAAHERKEKYLTSLRRDLQLAKDESYPETKVSLMEREVADLEHELSKIHFKGQKDLADSKLWHQNRFVKEHKVLSDKKAKHLEEQESTKKKRGIRIQEEEAKHTKAIEMIRTSFDAFDSAAATTLVEDDRLLANLERMHRENLQQLTEAESKAIQAQGLPPTDPAAPGQAQLQAVPVITPSQLNCDGIAAALAEAVHGGQSFASNTPEGVAALAVFFQNLMNKSVAMVSPTATAASLALAPTVASLSASPAAGALADRVHLLNASLPLIPLTPRGGTLKPPHTPRGEKNKTPRADEIGSGEPFAKDAKL